MKENKWIILKKEIRLPPWSRLITPRKPRKKKDSLQKTYYSYYEWKLSAPQ